MKLNADCLLLKKNNTPYTLQRSRLRIELLKFVEQCISWYKNALQYEQKAWKEMERYGTTSTLR